MPQTTKPTRPRRPRKGRNIRTLFKKYPTWAAIGTIILGTLLSWGVPMIPYDLHNGVLIILLAVLISLPFFFQAYQLYTHHATKKKTWIIIICLVIVGIVLIGSQLQFTETRPKLRIDFDSPATYTYTTNSTGEISLRIVNNGESAACQYYAIVFAAPENQLQQVKRLKQEFGTNCIDPTEPAYCNVHLNFTNQPTGVCYIYYKLIYSNSPTGGHLYTNDSPYWFSCDFTNAQKSFAQLTPAQRDIFKAAIKAYYPDEDIE